MPNIASLMKDEIVRLARKQVRKEVEGLRKASAQFRSDIAVMKRQVTALEKQIARLEKGAPKPITANPGSEDQDRIRFSSKGLATHRQRLGLSASELGTLLGVSAQSIYHWEAGKTKPRKQQLAAIAALRKMGKREVKAQLAKSID